MRQRTESDLIKEDLFVQNIKNIKILKHSTHKVPVILPQYICCNFLEQLQDLRKIPEDKI